MLSLAQNTEKIDSFVQHVTAGVHSWMAAGELLVEMVAESGEDALLAIQVKCPGLNRDTLDLFLSIGRREIYPMLALDSSPGAEFLAALDYDSQEKYYEEGILVADKYGEDEPDVTPVGSLTVWECRQVFDGGRIRTVEEQGVWLRQQEMERLKRKETRPKPVPKYRPPCSGDRTGFDADKEIVARSPMSLEELATATPLQLLVASLEQAHIALLDARRHLEKVKKGSAKDDLITVGLNAVGKLRYAASNSEL